GPEGWIGDAANQHFMEMEQFVIPGYKRLIEALNEAVGAMKFTQNEFHTADQEGSKAFKQLNNTGNAEAEQATQQGGGAPSSIEGGGQGSGGGPSGGGSPSGGGGDPSGGGSGQGQQGTGSGAQSTGSGGSLGTGGGSDSASSGGVRSGGEVSQAAGDGNNWMAGAAAIVTGGAAAAKKANDMRKKG
ncbi:MAG: hypothetical protein KDJ52_01625, partial [Anaerolineae bacterium]|nr:hypothetical protein [Anaerolineae bacterium]